MRKNKLLFTLLTLVSAISLSGCGFFASIFSEQEEYPYPSENESIPEGANYYRSDRSINTYHDLGNKNLYGQHFPKALGNNKILVIPVIIKGFEQNATELNRNRIQKAYFGTSEDTGWESVSSYFKKASFNQYNLSGDVTPWFNLNLTVAQINSYATTKYDDGGTFEVLHRAITWAKQQGYNMKDYDSDGNGFIDSVHLIYSCPNYQNLASLSSTYWAFTYVDYTNVNNPSTFNPVPNIYVWASYDFMDEGTTLNPMNIDAHTYIHEYGHLLGLEDYYDYDSLHMPLGGVDMQDLNVGDHNAYSKFALGWSRPYVVTGECTITISPASTSGHSILVRSPNSMFKGNAFSEYLLIELLTPTNLWYLDSHYIYPSIGAKTFTTPGVRIMHVDARLLNYNEVIVNKITSDSLFSHAYSNTPSSSFSQGSSALRDDLLALIPANNNNIYQTTFSSSTVANNSTLFKSGDSFSMQKYSKFFKNQKLHDGTQIPYTITFDSVSETEAKITFSL